VNILAPCVARCSRSRIAVRYRGGEGVGGSPRHRSQARSSRSFDRKVLVAAQAHGANKRDEPERAGCGMGNVEEGIAGLRMQLAIVLLRATMEAVVGVARAIRIRSDDLPESGPWGQLPSQRIVHCQDVDYRELRERLAGGRAAFAMDADHFDRLPALAALNGRRGHACLIGDDRELRGSGVRAQPTSEPGPIGARIEIPALEVIIPLGASAADSGALFRRDVEIGSIHRLLETNGAILRRRAAPQQS